MNLYPPYSVIRDCPPINLKYPIIIFQNTKTHIDDARRKEAVCVGGGGGVGDK